MTFETIALGLLTGYLIWRLYRAIANDKSAETPGRIRLVSKETGEVLEMKIVQTKSPQQLVGWSDERFVQSAKFVFQKILSAFAGGRLKELKQTLDPSVYQTFERDVFARQIKKQTMDFSLICFDSADIIHKNQDNTEITVRFRTEQINLLKDASGKVIEGDEMNIAVMEDTWVFKQVAKESWVVTSTQSRVAPCVR